MRHRQHLVLRCFLAAVGIVSMPARATALPVSSLQATETGSRVAGVVFDSVSRSILVGATVQLAHVSTGALQSTQTNASGRYTFESVAPGTYLLGFFHPVLDSLGLESGLRRLDIRSAEPLTVALAVPSARTIMTSLCSQAGDADSTALVLGHVRSAQDGAPRAALVRLRWDEYTIMRRRIARDTLIRTTATSPSGFYAICGVPAGVTVLLRAAAGTDSSGVVEVDALPGQLVKRDLSVGPAVHVALPQSDPTSPAISVSRGDARLAGVIRGENGKSTQGGRVLVWGTGLEASLGTTGRFSLDSLPSGSWTVEARALGFVPRRQTVELVPSRETRIEVVLTPRQAFLDTVRVLAQRAFVGGRLAEFEKRRRRGLGYFLDQDAIDRRVAAFFSELLWGIPGVSVVPSNGGFSGSYWILMRGMLGSYCHPAVYVDGVRYRPGEVDYNAFVFPERIIGIEVYTRGGMVPAEFSQLDGCGSVVVWTGPRARR